MAVTFHPLPETARSQPKGRLSSLEEPGFGSLLFAQSWFPRQLKPSQRLLVMWMGFGSVPTAFCCWVAPCLAGSRSTQRAKWEIPLSTSFLWSPENARTMKVVSRGGDGSQNSVFGLWLSRAAKSLLGWEKSPCRKRREVWGCWCTSRSTPKANRKAGNKPQ